MNYILTRMEEGMSYTAQTGAGKGYAKLSDADVLGWDVWQR
jgi:homoserine dehydrogenase